MILFEVERMFPTDYYLSILYKTIFTLGYYGLLRIGEIVADKNKETKMNHAVKAKDVHIGVNKNKILLVLYIVRFQWLMKKLKLGACSQPGK